LFHKKEERLDTPTDKEVEAHRELREAFLNHSRQSTSKIIARYL
jgi:hypothetical protein